MSFECGDIIAGVDPIVSDNCSEFTVSVQDTLYTNTPCYKAGAFIYTAVDACGNTSSFYQYYTIVDTTSPVFADFDQEIEMPCDNYAGIFVEASDICNEVEITYEDEFFSGGYCAGIVTRTYTATDACGNEATTQQVIRLIDEVDPTVEGVTESFEVQCGTEYEVNTPSFSDNCDNNLDITSNVVEGGDACAHTITYSWTAVDHCGNSTTATTVVTIVDTIDPYFTSVPENFTVEFCGSIEYGDAFASDLCDESVEVTVSVDTLAGDCPNSYTIVRTFTAADACGNDAIATQEISVVDTTAPTFNFVPSSDTLSCADYTGFEMATASDLCGDAFVTFSESSETITIEVVGNGDCGQFRTQSVGGWGGSSNGGPGSYRDANFASAFPNGLTIGCGSNFLVLTSAQAVEDYLPAGGSSAVLPAGTLTNPTNYNNQLASQLVAAVLSLGFDANDPNFGPSNGYLGDQVYASGPFQGMTVSQVVTIANQAIGGCTQQYNLVELADALAQLNLNYEGGIVNNGAFVCEETITLCAQLITINWTATDACGNEALASTQYVVYDNVAPTFDSEVSDVTVTCASEIPALVELTATDVCSEATVTRTVTVLDEVDACGNQQFRVNYDAVDACGNHAYTSYIVTVYDNVDPEFSSLPSDLTIACDAEIPAAVELTATDNCGGAVEVSMTETYVGEQPAEGSIADCNLMTPSLGANPCDYDSPWAMILFGVPTAHQFFVVQSGELVTYPNGTLHLLADVVNVNNAANGFHVDVLFENGMNWASWSTQNFATGFKADCGAAAAAANHTDWMYYVMNNNSSTMTGFGSYAGSSIAFQHAPSNKYFAFQLGQGANNLTNSENGFGGWFTFTGTFMVDGSAITGSNFQGSGDFAFDLDCCPEYYVSRCYTAIDCSGNVAQHCQNIYFGEETVNVDPQTPGSNEVTNEPMSALSVYPNPTAGQATFNLKSVETGKASIEIFDLAGARVATVINTSVEAGQEYNFSFDASRLATGVYVYRMTTGGKTEMGRLVISK